MKPIQHILLALLLLAAPAGRGADNVPDAARTVSERVVEPSPDVAAARRYADLPVSYATGSASVSLPLMTLSTPSLSVSLGLEYRCEAKRVDEPAGWVGLGWTLTGLGSVSRQVCGMPDDIEKEYLDFDAKEYDGKYTEKYFDKLLYNKKDAKADRYTIVTPEGHTATFFFKDKETVFLTATELDVWHEMTGDAKHRKIDKFRVRTPDGIFYEFAEKDTVEYVYHAYYRYSGMPNQDYKAVTAWHLTKIVNPEKTDSIEISYSRGCTWKKYHGCSSLASRTYTHSTQPGEFDQSGGSGGGSGGDDDDDGYKFIKIDLDNPHIDDDDYVKHLSATMSRAAGGGSYGVTTYLNPALPKAIKSKSGTIRFIFEQSGDRFSMRNGTANRLKKITLASPDNAMVRSADFGEGRLGDERRTLASLRINGDCRLLEGYSFAYRDTNKQSRDIFGYPNGKSLSTSWESVIGTDDLKLNKSRRWDGVHIHGGLLESMTTATGITTSFDYEPSRVELENSGGIFGNEIVIGTRIRSITATDNATQRQRVRTFDYFAPELSADIDRTRYDVFLEPSGTVEHLFNGLAGYYKYDMSVVFTGSSRLPGMPLENTRIYYGAVEETVTGTDLDNPVRTRYEYDLSEAKIYSAPCGSPIGNDGYEADGVRILGFDFYTTGGNAQVMHDTFRPHATTYYFEECLGCEPMLSKKTTYRQSGGEYVPHTTETHTYAVCDSKETKVGLHYDHLAFRVAETATIRNTIDNVGHVNYGAYEYENGAFSRLNTATGYRDSLGVHVYVRDWQGNIRAVVRRNAQGIVELEQATYYYPYGMPMAESTNPTINKYKYTGKELLTDHGVNIMDYGARFYDPETCIWLSVDPLAHEDYGTSPFVFCGANPINRVDRNGKIWETIWDIGNVVYDVGAAIYCHIEGDHDAAQTHWVDGGFDLGAALIPFVPAGTSKAVRASAEVVESTAKTAHRAENAAEASVKAVNKVEDAATATKAIHGNSKGSTKAQHVYEIYDTQSGKVVKTGISGGKKTHNGTKSSRATSQVNKWNKEEGLGKYDQRIVEDIPAGPNAWERALKAEEDHANSLRETRQLDDKKYHKRP